MISGSKMASWIDKLESEGKKRKRTKKGVEQSTPETPRGPVFECWVTLRPADPTSGDPGMVEPCYFVVTVDGMLTLTDRKGTPLRDAKPTQIGNHRPEAIASVLARARRNDDPEGGSFNRRLEYGPLPDWC
jgi:hypothetical protein